MAPTGIPAATPWGGGTWGEAFQMIWLSFDGSIFEDGKWVGRWLVNKSDCI